MPSPIIGIGTIANDGTGDPLRTAFQKVNRLPNADKTINAGSGDYTGTPEQKITQAIAAAVAAGMAYVYVPQSMVPYPGASVIFNNAVRMLREGGNASACDVVAYGADWSGNSESSTGIQAACNAAAISLSTNGIDNNHVEIPAGLYKITTPITVPLNVTILGNGQSRTILAQTTSGAATLIITNGSLTVTNNRLADFTIDGTQLGGGVGNGINVTNAAHLVIERVTIQNLNVAGQIGLNAVNMEDAKIRDCFAIAKLAAMKFATNSNNVVVDGCDIQAFVGGDGIIFDNTTVNSVVIGCNFEGGPVGGPGGNTGLTIDGTLGMAIIGNFFENWNTAAIGATTGVAQSTLIIGNALNATNNATAVVKYGSAGPNLGITVQNNFFVQLGQGGSSGVGVDLGTTSGPIAIFGNKGPGGSDGLMVKVNGVLQTAVDFLQFAGVLGVIGGVRDGRVALTWSTTPAVDASLGNYFELTATSNIAAVVQAPSKSVTNLIQSQELTFEIFNNSGGALGTAPTFIAGNNGFRMTAAAVNPANGTGVIYKFRWSAIWTRYVECSRTIAY